jgi:hypothetical protein
MYVFIYVPTKRNWLGQVDDWAVWPYPHILPIVANLESKSIKFYLWNWSQLRTTSVENDLSREQPHFRTNSVENNLSWEQPQLRLISFVDDRSQLKCTDLSKEGLSWERTQLRTNSVENDLSWEQSQLRKVWIKRACTVANETQSSDVIVNVIFLTSFPNFFDV